MSWIDKSFEEMKQWYDYIADILFAVIIAWMVLWIVLGIWRVACP